MIGRIAFALLCLCGLSGPCRAAPLSDAVKMGDKAEVARLLAAKTPVDEPTPEDFGMSPLFYAAFSLDKEMVALLAAHGAAVNKIVRPLGNPINPLGLAIEACAPDERRHLRLAPAAFARLMDIAAFLLDHGTRINDPPSLSRAAECVSPALVAFLLARKANPKMGYTGGSDKNGRITIYPLENALTAVALDDPDDKDWAAIMTLLLEHGADPNQCWIFQKPGASFRRSCLLTAEWLPDAALALSRPIPRDRIKKAVELLVAHGADVNAASHITSNNPAATTPLKYAIEHKLEDVVEILSAHGAKD